ncbi:MAG: RNA polymerase sigma factor [Thiolinea sp.]
MKTNDSVSQQLPEYLDALWRFAWRLSQNHDAAQELTQGTCLRALEYESAYRGGNLKSWLFKIMHNLWRDEVRHHIRAGLKVVSPGEADMIADRIENPEHQVLLREVQQMINRLPEAQRTVLLLTAVEGLSYRETAELLDVPLGTVMSRLARAREKMGQSVQQQNEPSVSVQSQEWSCKR